MKEQFKKKALLCGSVLLLTLASTYAQNNSNVSVAVAPNSMDPVLVTANRAPTLATNVLADYDYIGPEEIQQAGQTSLVDLLQRQRGVEISNGYGSGGSGASVFLRGTSNSQSIVLIDGVRSDSAFTGGPTWESIPLPLIDHIEIVFGPQSSLYGADAIGGVVQIFTKDGNGPAKVSVSSGYGSYGTSVSDASIYGSTEGEQKIRYSLGVSETLSTGYNTVASNNPFALTAMKTGYVQNGITGKISQEWEKGQVFGFQMLQSRIKTQVPGFNAGDYNNNPTYSACIYGTGPCGAPGPQQAQSNISQMGTYTLFSRNQITDIWKSSLQASISNNNGQIIEGATQYSPAYSPYTNTKQNIYTWQNDISLGSDLLQVLGERRTQSVNTYQYNYNTDYYTTGLPSLFSQTRDTNSAAASYQLKRGSSLANLSIRNDSISGYGPQTTGAIAYGYFLTKQWRANINYGTGFRAPTFNDLYYPGYGNVNLLPEKSKNTELGIHYDTSEYEAHVVAYSNSITNLIQFGQNGCTDYQISNSGGCASNVGYARITGVSFGSAAHLDRWLLKGSIDQQNPENVTSDTTLNKRARTFGNASVEYNYQKWIAGFGGTFSGQRQDVSGTDANTGNSYNGVMGGYSIFNLYSSYEFEKGWTVFGRWNNMFNKQYQLTYGYNPPGSNVFFGVRYAMR
ncbi:TonB-dependent receptor [Polynucleobacter asymbioticus]|nr:TonB-dependent receptor [Polynucleobacter asymbioticus]